MTETLWDNATRDVDAEVDARRMAAIRVAVAPHFAFLAKAADRSDFSNRYALVGDRVTASVERVVGQDLAPTYLTRIAAELKGDWHTLRMAHLAPRLAEDAYDFDDSCAVCGHGIDRDPAGEDNRTYHHADGEKHDHEAKPRTGAKVAITLGDLDKRPYDATCPNKSCDNHGTSFVHDDFSADNDGDDETVHCPDCNTPLAWQGEDSAERKDATRKTADGLDNLGDNKAAPFGSKDDDEDDDSTTKESKVASAPDGTKAKCGTCGKDIQSMDYAWYHMAKDFPNGEDHNAHPSPHKASKTAESHGGYHLEEGDGGWYVVNHIGERKNNEAMSHDKALAYQRALMVNVPGAKEDAERHEKASAKMADGVGPQVTDMDTRMAYANYTMSCMDAGTKPMSQAEWEQAGKPSNQITSVRRVSSLATLAPGTRLTATSAYLKQAGYPTCAEDCGKTLSASDDLINTDSGLAHTSCVLGDAGSRLGFSGGLRAIADAGWCECGHKKSAHTDGTGACTEQMGADGTCTCSSFRPTPDLPLESTSRRVTAADGGWHDVAVSVLTNGPKTVDGMLLDAYTASMLTQVHDALSPANQAKFREMPLKRAVDTGWALSKKTSAHTPRPGEIRGKCKRCGGGVHVRGGHDESGTYDVWRHDEAAKDLEHSVAPVSEHHQVQPEPRRPMVDWMGNVMAARVGPGPSSDADRCQRCYGKGWIDLGAGMDWTPADNTCPACKGTGIKGGKTSSRFFLATPDGDHVDGPFSDREDANAALSMHASDDVHVIEDDSHDDSEGEHHFGPGSSEFGSDRDRFETVSMLEEITAANTDNRTAAFGDDAWNTPNTNAEPPDDWASQNGEMAGTIDAIEGKPFNDGGGANGKGEAYARGYKKGFNAAGGRTAAATPAGRETDPTWNDHGACTDCNGSGQVPSLSPFDDPDNSGLQTCPTCGGSGIDPGTGMTGGDRRLANPQRTRVACRKCHAGKDPSGGACDYCDGHGSLDQTLAMVKEADGWSQGITAEAFTTQASPTYQTTALPGLTGKNVTITYTSDRGVDTASGVLSIEGNVAHVGGKSIALHNVLDFKANGYSDAPVGGNGREPSRFDLAGAGIGNGLFPGGAWGMSVGGGTGNTFTANMFDRGNNPFSTDGPGAPTNSPAGGADNDMGMNGPGNPTTTKPRAKPSSQPNAPAPQMDPMRMTMFPAAQPTVDPNSAAPAPAGDPRSAAKVMQIAEGILATNPGMNDTTALAIAKETVRRFPKVVASERDWGQPDFECGECDGTGKVDGKTCPVCGGSGRTSRGHNSGGSKS